MRLPRWLKKTLIGTASLVAVLALVVIVARASFRRMGTKELDRITARLDADDPGWRFDPLMAARAKAAPPADQNPAEVAKSVRTKFGEGWETFRNTRNFGGGAVSNELPGFWAVAWFLQAGTATADARATARTEFLRPELAGRQGHVALTVPDNPFMTLLPHAQNTREVFELLEIDAKLAVLEGRPDRGVTAARAGVAAVRALGDEPFLISQLVRIAGANVAANAGVQVLAWGEPKDKAELAALQAAYRAEADYPWLLTGLRGERASLDRAFEGLESGKIAPREFLMGTGANSPFVGVAFELYRGFLPGDRAMALMLYTEMIEVAQRPHHERKKAFQELKNPFADADGFRYIVTKLTLPAAHKVGEAEVRSRANLLTASAAVACERFRLERGRWPNSLEEIPVDILPPLPPDPYTGQPIQFRRVDDGVLIYAQADDLQPAHPAGVAPFPHNGAQTADPLAGIGRGWKLWDPELRGVPGAVTVPPPMPEPEGDENP